MKKKNPTSVEEYIEQLPEGAQSKINALRAILKSVVPEAKEGLKCCLLYTSPSPRDS